MAGAAGARGRTLSYAQARNVAVVVGLVIIGLLVVLLSARHVETIEVVAVLLFLPVFLALLKWDIVGGAIAGVLAALTYTAMRWSAIEAVGFDPFAGLVISRAFGFIAFGVIGGWANQQLRGSIDKLDLYDQIDDETGLYNARFLLQETDLEQARATRYESIFAVSVLDIPSAWFAALGRKPRDRVLHELGDLLTSSVRTVDRVGHLGSAGVHRLVVVLPETGPEGARVFTAKLADQLATWLDAHGVRGDGALHTEVVVFPEDAEALVALRATFTAIDQVEHPTHQ